LGNAPAVWEERMSWGVRFAHGEVGGRPITAVR
jgi:hypothetical protein